MRHIVGKSKSVRYISSLLFVLAFVLGTNIMSYAANAPSVPPESGVSSVYDLFEKKNFISPQGSILPYRLYVPENYDEAREYPLLVFFHGAGERGGNNSSQLFHVLQECFNKKDSPIYNSIVIAPQCPENYQWVDTPWSNGNYSIDSIKESTTMKSVVSLIDSIESKYSVDTGRLYMMGISMGGYAVWHFMARHPGIAAAAVPICGAGDVSKVDAYLQSAIWTFHGSADDTVPVSGTRALANAIEEEGAENFKYTEKAGVGHLVWYDAAKTPSLMTWLYSFDKTPATTPTKTPEVTITPAQTAETALETTTPGTNEEKTPESTVAPTADKTESLQNKNDSADKTIIIIIASLLVLSAIGITIFVVMHRKRGK